MIARKLTTVNCNCRNEIKVSGYEMVTVDKMILSTNVLPQPVLTQIKHTLEQQKENSDSYIITT